MTRGNALGFAAGALLAASAATAKAEDNLPYVTVNLNDFHAVAIHDRALALMRTDTVYDADGNYVTSDSNVWSFDDLRLRQLTRDGGSGKLISGVKRSDRYIGWAEFLDTGLDIMAYDLERGRVIDVSDTEGSENSAFDLRDDHFAWTVFAPDFSQDFVLSDGRRDKVLNPAGYGSITSEAQTSRGNAAFSAFGTDRRDGSSDSEVFYYDGATGRLRQVTDDRPIGGTGAGYYDELALISGDRVVFRTTHPADAEPYRLRIYDASEGRIRTILHAGERIVGGRRLVAGTCVPFQFDGDLLLWSGVLEGDDHVLLLTDVTTGRTVSLSDVTGGGVAAASTDGGYVAVLAAGETSTRAMLYRPSTGALKTLAVYGAGFGTTGSICNSGPDVAYACVVDDRPRVAVHYRLDSYLRELLGR